VSGQTPATHDCRSREPSSRVTIAACFCSCVTRNSNVLAHQRIQNTQDKMLIWGYRGHLASVAGLLALVPDKLDAVCLRAQNRSDSGHAGGGMSIFASYLTEDGLCFKRCTEGFVGGTPENDPLAFPQARLLRTLLAEQLGAMDVQVLHATAKRGILQTSKSTDFSGVIRYCGCAGLFPEENWKDLQKRHRSDYRGCF
jgi:hypothetical protein